MTDNAASEPPQGGESGLESGSQGSHGSHGAAPSPGTSVDPKTVNPLDWAIAGAALLALVFSFFTFYTYDANGVIKSACINDAAHAPAALKPLCSGDTASAWHGFFGWFGVILLVLAAVAALTAVFSPQLGMPVSVRLVGAGLGGLGTLVVLLALFLVPDWPPVAGQISDESQYDKAVVGGVGFSWYIVLALGLVVTVVSFLRFQQTGGGLPSQQGQQEPAQ